MFGESSIASEQDIWNIVVSCVLGVVVAAAYIFLGPNSQP